MSIRFQGKKTLAKITVRISDTAPATTNSGLTLTPPASSWKNLISPALEAGMEVLSRFFLLMS